MSTTLESPLIKASSIPLSVQDKVLHWTPEIMMQLKVISDVQLSPDKESLLFVVLESNMKEEKGVSLSRIYRASLKNRDNVLAFSAPDISSTQPRWSPDGKWIAFLSTRDSIKNLYLISAEGGEAIPLTKGKKDVQTFSWSPDGNKIAFVMVDETEREKNRKKKSLAYEYREKSSFHRLWLIDVFAKDPLPQALTSEEYCVRGCGDMGTINVEFDWSPDSTEIVFAYSPGMGFDDFHLESSLATLHLETMCIIPWEKRVPYEAMPRFSPDGKWVAYLTSDSKERYAMNRQLAICSRDGKSKRLLAKTPNEGAFIAGPHFLGWTKEGDHLLFYEPQGTKFHLVLIPVDGKPYQKIKTGDFFFKEPSLSYDRTMVSFVGQSPATPPEAYIASLEDFTPHQASSLNSAFLSLPKIETEVVSWQSTDGMKIEGLLSYPLNYEKGKTYPLLVVIHGGPMGFFDETFLGTPNPYPLASFAEEGFFIFRPNPRGSSGYGRDFRCANYQDWGGMDFMDVMSGVDEWIARGIADAERLGIMGWSYGGYLTAWTIGKTSRFKAASLGAGVYNLVSLNGTTDLHRFLPDYLGDFSENRKLYEERSPLNYVDQVKTPCLMQHGTEDKRVPVSQAYEYYHALERVGKTPKLLLYPGMVHRLIDPKMQLDAMEENLTWFLKIKDPC